jgi:hypothetical protein
LRKDRQIRNRGMWVFTPGIGWCFETTYLAFSDRAENRFVFMGLGLEDRMSMLEGEFGFV